LIFGNTFALNAAQCEQVIDAYSVILTEALPMRSYFEVIRLGGNRRECNRERQRFVGRRSVAHALEKPWAEWLVPIKQCRLSEVHIRNHEAGRQP
jgi:hypothetical protein